MTADVTTLIDHAVQWATSKIGVTNYATLCLAFVEDAYERGNNIQLDGYATAKEAADRYQATDDSSLPPRGALVFYDWWGTINDAFRNWGHVGLSLGDGCIIHALSEVRVDDYRAVPDSLPSDGMNKPSYIGWALVSAVLKGSQPRKWVA